MVTRFCAVNSAVGGSAPAEQRGHRTVGRARVAQVVHDQRRVQRQPGRVQRGPVAVEPLPRGDDACAGRRGRRSVGARRRPGGAPPPRRRSRWSSAPSRPAGCAPGGPRTRSPCPARSSAARYDWSSPAGASTSPSTCRAQNCLASVRSRDRVLVEAGRVDDHPARCRRVLDRPLHRGRERVHDVLEQQPDRCRPAIRAAQDAGANVRPEVELLDRPPDPPLEDGRHPALLVDDSGDGLEADPGPLRDVTHGRPAPARRGLPQWAHRPPSTATGHAAPDPTRW